MPRSWQSLAREWNPDDRYEAKSEAGKQLSALLVRRRQLDEMLRDRQPFRSAALA
jgi:hypothetical protein